MSKILHNLQMSKCTWCGTPCRKHCSICKETYYCGPSCRANIRSKHKYECVPLEWHQLLLLPDPNDQYEHVVFCLTIYYAAARRVFQYYSQNVRHDDLTFVFLKLIHIWPVSKSCDAVVDKLVTELISHGFDPNGELNDRSHPLFAIATTIPFQYQFAMSLLRYPINFQISSRASWRNESLMFELFQCTNLYTDQNGIVFLKECIINSPLSLFQFHRLSCCLCQVCDTKNTLLIETMFHKFDLDGNNFDITEFHSLRHSSILEQQTRKFEIFKSEFKRRSLGVLELVLYSPLHFLVCDYFY